jgi:hypothetical protein
MSGGLAHVSSPGCGATNITVLQSFYDGAGTGAGCPAQPFVSNGKSPIQAGAS